MGLVEGIYLGVYLSVIEFIRMGCYSWLVQEYLDIIRFNVEGGEAL